MVIANTDVSIISVLEEMWLLQIKSKSYLQSIIARDVLPIVLNWLLQNNLNTLNLQGSNCFIYD